MPQAISEIDIKRYKDRIKKSGVCGVKAVYLDLQKKGYTYAGWAYGVASGSTITGQAALDFMQQVEREKTGKEIPPSKIREIRINMALGYLDALDQNIKAGGGLTTTDANFKQIRDFHDKGFHDSGYSLDHWTLKVPMDLVYRYSGGAEGQERVWRALSKTEGNGLDAINSSMRLSSYVKLFSENNVLFRNIHTGEYISPSTYRINVDNLISRSEDYERQTIDSDDNLLAKNWASKIGYVKPLADWYQVHYDELRRLTDLNYSNKENCEPPDPKSNTYNDWFGLDRDGIFYQYDPLALDLNGNGIETLAANGHDGAMFDHERNGIRTATGWVHSNDGLLVHDRNGDGKISDGSELFGDNTLLKDGSTAAHGFAALAELDENGDGKVDAADSAFKKLGVWRDLNHNGISEEGEISSLEDMRVQSLNLAYKNADQNLGNGNTLAEVGSYTDEDGKEHIMGDLRLAADRFHSRFSDSIELTDAQRREVNLGGSGRVRDLREAAAQSSELAEVLQQYKNAATKEEQLALRDKLLQAWANTDKSRDSIIKISADFTIRTQQDRRRGIGLTPSQIRHMQSIMSRNIWELIGESDPDGKRQAELYRRIGVLDSFTGTRSSRLYYFNEAQAKHIIDTANGTYDKLVDSLYDGLLFQTRLRPYLDAMRLRVDEKGEYSLDYSGVSALFNEIHKKNPGKAFTDLGELLAKSNDGKNPALAQLAEQHTQYMAEAAQNGTLTQYAETLGKKNMDTLGHRIGTDDNDNLSGNASANYLTGGAGNDKLYGGKGHDTLVGGAGNDYMEGGDYESDTYHFARGHGKDTVYDWSHNDEEADTLRFHGAQSGAAVIDREGYDLTIRAYGSGEQVNIKDYFWNNTRNHYNLQFDDTTLTNHDLAARSFTVNSTTNAGEKLYGWESHDTIHAGAGDDHITAYGGNDTIDAGAGNDTIDAGAGDDTIDAGTGNDKIDGGEGNDRIDGGNGDDKIRGGKGHDELTGGADNDYMEGGDYEADTYHFARGHGKDTVYDWSRGAAEADTLTFHGAKAKDAVFGREGSDLTIRAYGNADDQVTVQSYYSRPGQNYYNLQFDDITYKAADIRERTLETEGLPTATTATDKAGEVAPATTVPAENNQSGTDGQTVMEPVSSTAVNAGTTGVTNAAETATTDRTPSGANSQTTAPATSGATETGALHTNKAAATAATPDIDAQAAAQAHRLITAMAASDGRSASTEALAAPPLQQPPLAAAATDSAAKPLLP